MFALVYLGVVALLAALLRRHRRALPVLHGLAQAEGVRPRHADHAGVELDLLAGRPPGADLVRRPHPGRHDAAGVPLPRASRRSRTASSSRRTCVTGPVGAGCCAAAPNSSIPQPAEPTPAVPGPAAPAAPAAGRGGRAGGGGGRSGAGGHLTAVAPPLAHPDSGLTVGLRPQLPGTVTIPVGTVWCRHGHAEGGPGGRRPGGDDHQPGQGRSSRGSGITKLDLVRYYLAVADGALRGVGAGRWRSSGTSTASTARPFYQKRAPENAARLDRDGGAALPVGPYRARDRGTGRGPAGLGGQPRLHRPAPAPGTGRGSGPPRRAAGRPRPDPGRAVGAGARGGPGGPRGAGRLRPGRLAQDVGLARAARLLPHRAAVDVHRAAPGRAGAGPRGRAPGARPGDQPMVEGGAARRLRRLQPERQGPHDRLGVLGAPDAGRAGLHAAVVGRGARLRARGVHHRLRAGAGWPSAGDPAAGIDDAAGRWTALLELAERHRAAGLPDAPAPSRGDGGAGRPRARRAEPAAGAAARCR